METDISQVTKDGPHLTDTVFKAVFKLEVAAATLDITLNEEVYTQQAVTHWQFDADGLPIWSWNGNAFASVGWTPTGAGYTPKDGDKENKWTPEKGDPYPARSTWKVAVDELNDKPFSAP